MKIDLLVQMVLPDVDEMAALRLRQLFDSRDWQAAADALEHTLLSVREPRMAKLTIMAGYECVNPTGYRQMGFETWIEANAWARHENKLGGEWKVQRTVIEPCLLSGE